jgi:hypothetical protein
MAARVSTWLISALVVPCRGEGTHGAFATMNAWMMRGHTNTSSTLLAPKGWSPKGATIKVQSVVYRTGSTHGHADRLVRADRGRPRTLHLRGGCVREYVTAVDQ